MRTDVSTPQQERSWGVIPILQAILASVGATGILVGTGYIVAYSREHLLGIDITRAATTLDYAAIGARFFAEVTVMLYRHASSQIRVLSAGLIVLIVLMVAARRIIVLPPLRYRSLYMLLMLGSLIGKLAYYDIPFVLHRDILLSRLDYSMPPEATPFTRHGRELWEWFVCKHDIHNKCGVAVAERNLESFFVGNVLATAFLAYGALLTLRNNRRQRRDSVIPEPLGGLSIPLLTGSALLMSVLSVPFTYGKSVWSAQMPNVVLTLRETDSRAPIGDGKSPQHAEMEPPPAEAAAVQRVFGLLLTSDDKIVLVYALPDNIIVEYLRSDIKSIRLRGDTVDLVGQHIAIAKRDDGT